VDSGASFGAVSAVVGGVWIVAAGGAAVFTDGLD
jgi:hypothetical protein